MKSFLTFLSFSCNSPKNFFFRISCYFYQKFPLKFHNFPDNFLVNFENKKNTKLIQLPLPSKIFQIIHSVRISQIFTRKQISDLIFHIHQEERDRWSKQASHHVLATIVFRILRKKSKCCNEETRFAQILEFLEKKS